MSKLHSSQELVIYQVDVDRLSQSIPRPHTASHTLGGSNNVGAAAILTPEIRRRSEWFSSLDSVDNFSLPHYVYASTFSSSRQKKVRYVSDSYDRKWLLRHAESVSTSSAVNSRIISEDDVCAFEDVITLLEMEAIHHPGTPLDQLRPQLKLKGLDPQLISDIHRYWLKKRSALGGNVSCIPSLWRNEDQQTMLCRSDILGDCPIPFKSRDWVCAVILRKPTIVSGRKRIHTESDSSGRKMCVAALNLSMQIFLREQLQWEHTCSALYELAYMRSVAHTLGHSSSGATLDENVTGEQDDPVVSNPENVVSQLLSLPCVSWKRWQNDE